jgi:hypothetical protein
MRLGERSPGINTHKDTLAVAVIDAASRLLV